MNLSALCDALRADFDAALPCNVAMVGGAFDSAELRRHVVNAPIVLLALTDISDLQRHSHVWKARVTLQAYVVARDTADASREALAMDLVGQIIHHAHGIETLSTTDGTRMLRPGADAGVSAENLYSGAIDSVAIALWGVRWRAIALLP